MSRLAILLLAQAFLLGIAASNTMMTMIFAFQIVSILLIETCLILILVFIIQIFALAKTGDSHSQLANKETQTMKAIENLPIPGLINNDIHNGATTVDQAVKKPS